MTDFPPNLSQKDEQQIRAAVDQLLATARERAYDLSHIHGRIMGRLEMVPKEQAHEVEVTIKGPELGAVLIALGVANVILVAKAKGMDV